jgi:plasmid stabilization system protein ParE
MTPVVFHIGALRALRGAREWYASKGVAEQGARLVRLVDARVRDIAEHPESFPRDSKRSWARRARILGWPYTLIFVQHASTVIVLALAHGKRRPRYWARRKPPER